MAIIGDGEEQQEVDGAARGRAARASPPPMRVVVAVGRPSRTRTPSSAAQARRAAGRRRAGGQGGGDERGAGFRATTPSPTLRHCARAGRRRSRRRRRRRQRIRPRGLRAAEQSAARMQSAGSACRCCTRPLVVPSVSKSARRAPAAAVKKGRHGYYGEYLQAKLQSLQARSRGAPVAAADDAADDGGRRRAARGPFSEAGRRPGGPTRSPPWRRSRRTAP